MYATDLHLSGVPGVLGGLPGAVAVQLAHHGGGDGVLHALVEHVAQDAAHQQHDKQHQQDDEVLTRHGTVRSVACMTMCKQFTWQCSESTQNGTPVFFCFFFTCSSIIGDVTRNQA